MCTNTGGSFQCSCGAGYVLTADGSTCEGTKLRAMAAHLNILLLLQLQTRMNVRLEMEDVAQICTNTMGSFLCSCEVGFTLAEDNLSCAGKLHAILHN